MTELMVIMAKITPEENLIKELDEALQAYKVISSDKNKSKILAFGSALITKWSTEKDKLEDVLQTMKQVNQSVDFFKANKQ